MTRQFSLVGSFDISSLSDIELVVGEASTPYVISVNIPPETDVSLTPSSPSLTFSPATLVFSSTQSRLVLRITGTSAANTQPIISWAVGGNEAGWYDTPDLVVVTTVALSMFCFVLFFIIFYCFLLFFIVFYCFFIVFLLFFYLSFYFILSCLSIIVYVF